MPKKRSGHFRWSKLVLPIVGLAIVYVWEAQIVSTAVTILVFAFAQQLPDSFLVGLVTLNGLLIAVVAFVSSVVFRAIGIEAWREKLEKMSGEQGVVSAASQLGLAGIYTIPTLAAMMAVVPYFTAAVLSLTALLMPPPISNYLGLISFWLTLTSFLGGLLLAWRVMTTVWDAQSENIAKVLVWIAKHGLQGGHAEKSNSNPT